MVYTDSCSNLINSLGVNSTKKNSYRVFYHQGMLNRPNSNVWAPFCLLYTHCQRAFLAFQLFSRCLFLDLLLWLWWSWQHFQFDKSQEETSVFGHLLNLAPFPPFKFSICQVSKVSLTLLPTKLTRWPFPSYKQSLSFVKQGCTQSLWVKGVVLQHRCVSERQRAFRAFCGDVMGEGVMGY